MSSERSWIMPSNFDIWEHVYRRSRDAGYDTINISIGMKHEIVKTITPIRHPSMIAGHRIVEAIDEESSDYEDN